MRKLKSLDELCKKLWETGKVRAVSDGYLYPAYFDFREATHFRGCLWTSNKDGKVFLAFHLCDWEPIHGYPTVKVLDKDLPLVYCWDYHEFLIKRGIKTTKEYQLEFFAYNFGFEPYTERQAKLIIKHGTPIDVPMEVPF